MANALADSPSPYLQRHAGHPVDWQPWSPEVLAQAAEQGRPLLISIGYAACHWCRAMGLESFADPAVAERMNADFVCITVDREERPDLDAIYLDACEAVTGAGGWPLNVFATPQGHPFFAVTYAPPEPRPGAASWSQVLTAVAEAWRDRRDELEETGARLTAALAGAAGATPDPDLPGPASLEGAVATLGQQFDSVHGGFGGAPKFPPTSVLGFLLARRSLPMARYTLRSMASGGIFDQVGGGFHRYAVDASWSVPHFEKMLPDNALLAARYAEAATITGDPAFGRIAERTLDWVLAELGDDDGGLAAGLGADSGGAEAGDGEGAFYRWTPGQLREVLGPEDTPAAVRWFGLTGAGATTGEGGAVLEQRGDAPAPEQATRILSALATARAERPGPLRDGKRIVSWNALGIEALATSAIRLGRTDHLEAARRCADLILRRARDERGRLQRLIPAGDGPDGAGGPAAGVLDDHAHLLGALVALHEADGSERWLVAAVDLAGVLLRDFLDPELGGFFSTAHDHEALIVRRKELIDTPLPSGQASAALALLRLHGPTGDEAFRSAAIGVLRHGARPAVRHPAGMGRMLAALDLHLSGPAGPSPSA